MIHSFFKYFTEIREARDGSVIISRLEPFLKIGVILANFNLSEAQIYNPFIKVFETLTGRL